MKEVSLQQIILSLNIDNMKFDTKMKKKQNFKKAIVYPSDLEILTYSFWTNRDGGVSEMNVWCRGESLCNFHPREVQNIERTQYRLSNIPIYFPHSKCLPSIDYTLIDYQFLIKI